MIELAGIECEPWLFRPDGGILERLEWKTDVLPSFDGSEQRVKLRATPRRSFEWSLALTDRERQLAENLLHARQAAGWAIPVWPDKSRLAVAVAPAAGTISVDTTTRDYEVGGLAVLMTSPTAFEVVEIAAVAAGSITTAAPVVGAWAAGLTEIAPLRAAYFDDEIKLARFTGGASYGRIRLNCIGVHAWPAAADATYRSAPVLRLAPNWTPDVEQTYGVRQSLFDPGTGAQYRDSEASGAIKLQSHRWLVDGRDEIDTLRRWLYAREGRLADFWLPTFALDLTPVATISAVATTIDVAHCGYTDHVAQGIGRRDIRIELFSGVSYERRISASAEVSGAVERLTIGSALGASVAVADIRSISFMDRVRLESDAIELAWWRDDAAECAAMTRGSRNDL